MGVIWNKVWFDIWQNKVRSMLVVLSIAAGVFSVGAIFGMVFQLLDGMDAAHQLISPSHVNVILRNYIDLDVVDELKGISGVRDIDPVNQISVRYRLDPEDEWELGTLVQRPDYENQTFDIVELKNGEWPEGGDIGIERLSSQHYDVEINDQITFEIGGEPRNFDVNGVIRHPFVQPPLFGGQANFFTDTQGLAEFGIPEGFFGQLLVQVEPYSLEKAREVAAEIRSELARQGYGVAVTLYQEPDRHWGRMFVEGVTLVNQVIAVVSLFLSVVIVFNVMTAVITQQTNQIGIIKSIGGGRGIVMRVFLAEVLIFSLVALIIAVPASMVFSYQLSRWFLNLFNIDYEVFQYSQWAVLIAVLSGLFAPILASIWPVMKGASISVREAIATYGLGGDFGSNRFDQVVDKFGARFLPTAYAVALGNMFRRKGRLVLTVLVMTIAGVMFMAVMSLVSSINLTLDNETARQRYDIRLGFVRNQSIPAILSLVEPVDGVEDAQMWYSRNATILKEGERMEDSAGLGAQLIGIPVDDALYQPVIVEGRWLAPGDERVVVINQETADKNQIEIGDMISLDLGEFGAESWMVAGTYKTIYGGGFLVEPIYAPIEAMAEVTQNFNQGTQLLLVAPSDTLEEEEQIVTELTTLLESQGIKIDFYTSSAKLEQRQYADNQYSTVVWMLLSLAIIVATVGGIGLMGSLGISVVERRREIGVMRAIGARGRSVEGVFIMEGLFQGLISFFFAVPLAYLLARPLANELGRVMIGIDLDFAFNYPAVALWLVIALLISFLVSLIPARSATKVNVRESLSYA